MVMIQSSVKITTKTKPASILSMNGNILNKSFSDRGCDVIDHSLCRFIF